MGWSFRRRRSRLEDRPGLFTVVQSTVVCCLAATLAVALWETIGRYHPVVWYQVFAAVAIAAVLSPIFLFPSYRTAHRLRIANRIIQRHATIDTLTRLPNLHALITELEARYYEDGQAAFAVHMLDIGRLKQVNETFGHLAGNDFVRLAARRIRDHAGADDFVARIGGGEFVVVQSRVSGHDDVRRFAEAIKSALDVPAVIDGRDVPMDLAVGSALSPDHGSDPTRILQAADIALDETRREGRSQSIFKPRGGSLVRLTLELETGLLSAIEHNEFFLEFQPIFDVGDLSRPVMFEALLRWKRGNGEIVSPGEFIPVAERSGLIVPIGAHALRLACLAQRSWAAGIGVSVNVSPRQIFERDFPETLRTVMAETGIDPGHLDLEVTESFLIEDAAAFLPLLNEIRRAGCRIVLDDFGSGYSGIPYLRSFSFDKVKIDKTLVDEICHCQKSLHILEAVAEMGRQMGFAVTAEGVDSAEKRDLLTDKRLCTELQGFLLGRPMPLTSAILHAKASGEAKPRTGACRKSKPLHARDQQPATPRQ